MNISTALAINLGILILFDEIKLCWRKNESISKSNILLCVGILSLQIDTQSLFLDSLPQCVYQVLLSVWLISYHTCLDMAEELSNNLLNEPE